jgi:anti-sigma regulatory factor (Ser/Thr protein kinase)
MAHRANGQHRPHVEPSAHVPAQPSAHGPRLAGHPRPLRLNVTSDPANLATVRRACEAFCVECGLGDAAACEVGLVVNEAMANITRHAYAGAYDRPVSVACDWDPAANGVVITLRDWGSGFNPASVQPKRDPMQPGGLGLVCIRSLMDEVQYVTQPDGMLLRMTKYKK